MGRKFFRVTTHVPVPFTYRHFILLNVQSPSQANLCFTCAASVGTSHSNRNLGKLTAADSPSLKVN